MSAVVERGGPEAAHGGPPHLPVPDRPMRIGEVAELIGTTPRTIRYYEELGLLGDAGDERESGRHRLYASDDVDRITEVVRLKDLLGLPLTEVRTLVEREAARAAVRSEYHRTEDRARRRELLVQLRALNEAKLELVQSRGAQLAALEAELSDRLDRIRARLAEL